MVLIKEDKRRRVVKAPFRGIAAVVKGTGLAMCGIGRGLCAVGNKVKMGNSSEWIPKDGTKDGKRIKSEISKPVVFDGGARTKITIFNEKGEKMWKDDDSVASTTAGSTFEEKSTKEFF